MRPLAPWKNNVNCQCHGDLKISGSRSKRPWWKRQMMHWAREFDVCWLMEDGVLSMVLKNTDRPLPRFVTKILYKTRRGRVPDPFHVLQIHMKPYTAYGRNTSLCTRGAAVFNPAQSSRYVRQLNSLPLEMPRQCYIKEHMRDIHYGYFGKRQYSRASSPLILTCPAACYSVIQSRG